MKISIMFILLLFSTASIAETIMDQVLNLDSSNEELIKINTNVPVSINVEIITNDLAKAFECRSCLHLSHKLLNGHIEQKNSSNIAVGFIEVQPEQGVIHVVVSHDHPSVKNVKITVKERQ